MLRHDILASMLRHDILASMLRHDILASMLRHDILASMLRHDILASMLRHDILASMLRHDILASMLRTNGKKLGAVLIAIISFIFDKVLEWGYAEKTLHLMASIFKQCVLNSLPNHIGNLYLVWLGLMYMQSLTVFLDFKIKLFHGSVTQH